MLLLFSAEQRFTLNHLQRTVEQLHYRSNKTEKESRTICNRMRFFCKFYIKHKIKDTCLPDKKQDQRNFFMAMYALHIISGESLVCRAVKVSTVKLYLKAAEELCKPRRLISPLINETGRRPDWIESVLKEHKRWEEMPNR